MTTPDALGIEHLPPNPCTQGHVGPTLSLRGRQNTQQRGDAGLGETAVPWKTWLTRKLNYPEGALRPLESRTKKSKKVECELPLTGTTQGQQNWWTKGLRGSRRILRNWTGGWTTAKSVAQEGRKLKPIPPHTPSSFTDRKTTKTDLTGLKPTEDIFFSFSLNSFFLPSFLPSFPPSVLPSFRSFSIPFSFHLFLYTSPFPTGETIKPGALKRPELDPNRGHPITKTVTQISLCYSRQLAR